jgi:hypothetical protein
MPTTTGMKTGGYYDAHSSAQRVALEAFLPWLEDAVAQLTLPSDLRPVGLLDLGSSEGGNAIYAMGRLIRALRQRGDRPIWVLFDDLPTNDFNRLFTNLFPQGGEVFAEPEVYAAAVGGSAFGRVVPAGSVHIATTYNAIGFLESLPEARLPNFILPMPPGAAREGVSVNSAEHEPFRRQAAADMRSFYRARAAELTNGGWLLVQVFGRDGDSSTSHGIYDVLSDALLDLIAEGLIPRGFYQDMVFPVYFRQLDELLDPIASDSELCQAFRVERADVREVAVPFNTQRAADGDGVAWARSYMGFLRAFTEPVLLTALRRHGLDRQVSDTVYQRVERCLIADPRRYDFRYIALGVLLKRL